MPTRFEPKFLDELDSRQTVVKKLREQFESLVKDAGIDSIQKRMIAELAIHLYTRISTEIVRSKQGEEISWGSVTQMCNALSGLLTKIGLERKAASVTGDIENYLEKEYGIDD